MMLSKAERMALDLMDLHDLRGQGWGFTWDNAKVRFGQTNHRNKMITLSMHLTELNRDDEVRSTILHEIGHAMVGKGHGHDRVWKMTVAKIGGDPSRCYDSRVVAQPKRPFKGTCPNCKREVERHQRRQIACGKCCAKFNHGRFDAAYLFAWSRV